MQITCISVYVLFSLAQVHSQSHYAPIILESTDSSSGSHRKLVDGDDDTCITDLSPRTDSSGYSPWWYAQFENNYNEFVVKLYAASSRVTEDIRFYAAAGTEKWYDSEICMVLQWTQFPSNYNITCNKTGGVFGFKGIDRSHLSICEVRIYSTSCADGWYGDTCNKWCENRHCISRTCPKTGACNSCYTGWFKSDCSVQCHPNCGSCDQSTGRCQTCEDNRYILPACNRLCSDRSCMISDTNCQQSLGKCSPCINGSWGEYCTQRCHTNCSICNQISSSCTVCVPDHYQLPECNRLCSDRHCTTLDCGRHDGDCDICSEGWRGSDCTLRCKMHCAACDQHSGACTKCHNGEYSSPNCSLNCTDRHCQHGNSSCPLNGTCDNCEDGYHGVDCLLPCSGEHCATCEQFSGKCKQCNDSWFGTDCDKKCSDNCLACEKDSGACLSCSNRTYSLKDNCTKSCDSRHCRRDETCTETLCQDTINCSTDGRCDFGCEDGYYGDDCVTSCTNYDNNCTLCDSQMCLSCAPGYHITDGSCVPCPRYCTFCESSTHCTTCLYGHYGPTCDAACSVNCVNVSCEQLGGECTNGCESSFYGATCNNTCDYCESGKCFRKTGRCLIGCISGRTGADCSLQVTGDDDDKTTAIATAVGVSVFVVLAVGVGIFVIRSMRRRRMRKSNQNGSVNGYSSAVPPYETGGNYEDITSQSVTYSNIQSTKSEEESPLYGNTLLIRDSPTAIEVSCLWKYIENKKEKETFEAEYENLPSGKTLAWTHALKPMNVNKNRYRNIYAYDHSRVVLSLEDDEGGDYMNANFIDGYKKTRKYIASQGVTAENIDDFWRMLWQENVKQVVMLTNILEEGKVKCLQYWPNESGQSIKYGKVKVQLIDENIFVDFTIRRFLVNKPISIWKYKGQFMDDNTFADFTIGYIFYDKAGYKENRSITHFHFTSWPDRGVPTSSGPLINFHKRVKAAAQSTNSPLVVHCSAGIGRTGCFIAIDTLIDEGNAESYVDVFGCVTDLRKQRVDMIQTVDQYIFTHDCVAEALMFGEFVVRAEEFPDTYRKLLTNDPVTKQSFLAKQYARLQEKSAEIRELDYSSAKDQINIKKNRHKNILASDSCRPFLSTPVKGCTDYINAVIISGKRDKSGIILTQTPLPGTVVDFWRLVYEQDSRTIVVMDAEIDETVGVYWPKPESQSTFGPFRISSESFHQTDIFSVQTLNMSYSAFHNENEERTVKLFKAKFWPPERIVPKTASSFLLFHNEIECWQNEIGDTRMVVHCMNGVDRSGLFAALSNILKRVKLQEEVSIAPIIANHRMKRKEIITSLDQYQYCHEVVLTHLEEANVYQNI